MKKLFLSFIIIFCFLVFTQEVRAANVGDSVMFNVDSGFDEVARSQIQAVLVKVSPSLYFYIDTGWWNLQGAAQRQVILNNLDNLATEFDGKIYPTLTSVFGFEWSPGIDNDRKIAVLFHSMKTGAAGYFRSADEYGKLQVPNSNEREMMYLSIDHINDSQLKVLVGHEFAHIIAFNQKDRIRGVQEEVWLNELRADYTSTLLGYDTPLEGSNLQHRIKDFLGNPADSLTEWKETKYDYAAASLFSHYLVDHYGIGILADSLQSKSVGIESINQYLASHGFGENFAQAFTNWTVASALNDCAKDQAYCYTDAGLVNFRITPALNFLPLSGEASLTVTNVIKNWSANWQKIIGGSGDLALNFKSLAGINFKVPYIIFDRNNGYRVSLLQINSDGTGHADIPDFGAKYSSLVIIPSLEAQFAGFDTLEISYPYTFTASISGIVSGDDPILIEKLLAQIDSLKKQIAALQAGKAATPSCVVTANLYIGLQNSQVSCLQQFLGVISTGYFGSLTRAAVVAFQQKWGIPATGFVGVLTRAKISSLQ